ncbi:DUF6082 family protein [Streptomyces sp. NBC_00280]|uniref:DUF6082 family protein n=1 Tax=Streptomyces sp. NBC_00280 TaxID=2975699 RepID=UPI00352C3CD8
MVSTQTAVRLGRRRDHRRRPRLGIHLPPRPGDPPSRRVVPRPHRPGLRIGAAYGFTSAIVSALASAGVVVSLIVQNRQARADQVQGIRSHYLELVRLELDDMALFQPV